MTLFRCSCLLPLALLTACATAEPRVVVKEVRVPVAIACAPKVAEPPAYAADVVDLNASLFDLVRALLIDREQRKGVEGELRAGLKACGP